MDNQLLTSDNDGSVLEVCFDVNDVNDDEKKKLLSLPFNRSSVER